MDRDHKSLLTDYMRYMNRALCLSTAVHDADAASTSADSSGHRGETAMLLSSSHSSGIAG